MSLAQQKQAAASQSCIHLRSVTLLRGTGQALQLGSAAVSTLATMAHAPLRRSLSGLALPLALLGALLGSLPAPAAAGKVFGLGPGRTGTDSLRQAFVDMGLGPAYHMKEVLVEDAGVSTEGHIEAWHKAANGVPVDFSKLLANFNSGCDYPLSAFPEELLSAFPDAKFVLTKRPADKWFKSINATICQFNGDLPPISILKHIPFGPFPRMKAQV